MKITIKLPSATYVVRTDNNSITAELIYTGKDKDGNPREGNTPLGYYGPGHIELAIKRIIGEEINRNQDATNLREFLKVYKGIQEIINPQLADLAQAIKEHRLETN